MIDQPNTEANLTHSLRDVATHWEIAKLFREINWRVNRGLAFENVLDFVFDALSPLIPFDRLGIALLSETGAHASLVWVKAKNQVKFLHPNYSYSLRGSTLERILETRQPRIIADLREFALRFPGSRSTELALADGVRSSLTCALKDSDDRPVGFAFFSRFDVDGFRDAHIDLFRELAGELSTIIEQGRLRRFFDDNRAKAHALTMVLNDLETPLGIIQGYLDVALGESWYEKADAGAKEALSLLRKNSTEMGRLIKEIQENIQ